MESLISRLSALPLTLFQQKILINTKFIKYPTQIKSCNFISISYKISQQFYDDQFIPTPNCRMGNKIGFEANKNQLKLVIAEQNKENIDFIRTQASQYIVNQFKYSKYDIFQLQTELQTLSSEKFSRLYEKIEEKMGDRWKDEKIKVRTNWETIKIIQRNENLRLNLQKIFRAKIDIQHAQRAEVSVQVIKIFRESRVLFTFSENFQLTEINRFQKFTPSKKVYIQEFPSDFLLISLKNGCSYYLAKQGTAEKIDGSILGEKTLFSILKMKFPKKTTKQLLGNAFKGKLKNTQLLVEDIYGKGVEKLGLPKDLVASSLGKLGKMSNEELAVLTDSDITRSLLTAFAINIGIQISLNMRKQNLEHALFLANQLHNCYNFYRMVQAVLDTFAPGKKIYFSHYSPFISCIGSALGNDL